MEMKSIRRSLLVIIIVTLMVLIAGCSKDTKINDKMIVAVSIVPEETFVKAVAGDLVEVVTLIPPGASPTNYQPSPKEMTQLSDASIYFTIDVTAEINNIMPNISSMNSDIVLVDLADAVDEIYPARYFEEEADDHDAADDEVDDHEADDHDHSGRDPHIWMSPKRVIVMIGEIESALSHIDPENEAVYKANAEAYIVELEKANAQIIANLAGNAKKEFIIMHPSIGYFADDYGLHMVAIEDNGKDASASHLETVIDFANEFDIKVILYQSEFDSSQAKTIADEIGGTVQEFAPLSEDYINEVIKLSEVFIEK